MGIADREKWNSKYAKTGQNLPATPEWLTRNLPILPRGSALDVATGRGSVAIELARNGWDVTAIDVSDVGIHLATDAARHARVHVEWIVADLDTFRLPANRFDLITVFHFLERQRLPAQLIAALRPGGALLFETFTVSQLRISGNHLTNVAHMLEPAELLGMFRPLPVRSYREVELPDRAVASLLAIA